MKHQIKQEQQRLVVERAGCPKRLSAGTPPGDPPDSRSDRPLAPDNRDTLSDTCIRPSPLSPLPRRAGSMVSSQQFVPCAAQCFRPIVHETTTGSSSNSDNSSGCDGDGNDGGRPPAPTLPTRPRVVISAATAAVETATVASGQSGGMVAQNALAVSSSAAASATSHHEKVNVDAERRRALYEHYMLMLSNEERTTM